MPQTVFTSVLSEAKVRIVGSNTCRATAVFAVAAARRAMLPLNAAMEPNRNASPSSASSCAPPCAVQDHMEEPENIVAVKYRRSPRATGELGSASCVKVLMSNASFATPRVGSAFPVCMSPAMASHKKVAAWILARWPLLRSTGQLGGKLCVTTVWLAVSRLLDPLPFALAQTPTDQLTAGHGNNDWFLPVRRASSRPGCALFRAQVRSNGGPESSFALLPTVVSTAGILT
mmetsp:Transcript_19258/g.73726  ORF Transcript_19258/g.73726 Transcript_19258/m.73726 type:complete len:231 (-) Transcript_19258:187-879(-)